MIKNAPAPILVPTDNFVWSSPKTVTPGQVYTIAPSPLSIHCLGKVLNTPSKYEWLVWDGKGIPPQAFHGQAFLTFIPSPITNPSPSLEPPGPVWSGECKLGPMEDGAGVVPDGLYSKKYSLFAVPLAAVPDNYPVCVKNADSTWWWYKDKTLLTSEVEHVNIPIKLYSYGGTTPEWCTVCKTWEKNGSKVPPPMWDEPTPWAPIPKAAASTQPPTPTFQYFPVYDLFLVAEKVHFVTYNNPDNWTPEDGNKYKNNFVRMDAGFRKAYRGRPGVVRIPLPTEPQVAI